MAKHTHPKKIDWRTTTGQGEDTKCELCDSELECRQCRTTMLFFGSRHSSRTLLPSCCTVLYGIRKESTMNYILILYLVHTTTTTCGKLYRLRFSNENCLAVDGHLPFEGSELLFTPLHSSVDARNYAATFRLRLHDARSAVCVSQWGCYHRFHCHSHVECACCSHAPNAQAHACGIFCCVTWTSKQD